MKQWNKMKWKCWRGEREYRKMARHGRRKGEGEKRKELKKEGIKEK